MSGIAIALSRLDFSEIGSYQVTDYDGTEGNDSSNTIIQSRE